VEVVGVTTGAGVLADEGAAGVELAVAVRVDDGGGTEFDKNSGNTDPVDERVEEEPGPTMPELEVGKAGADVDVLADVVDVDVDVDPPQLTVA
jgi:hypothetical protein